MCSTIHQRPYENIWISYVKQEWNERSVVELDGIENEVQSTKKKDKFDIGKFTSFVKNDVKKSPLINFINIKLWSHECSLKILTNFYIFLLWQQYFGVIVKLAILFWVKLWIYFIQLLSPPGQQVNDLFRLSNDFFFKARSIWREIAE